MRRENGIDAFGVRSAVRSASERVLTWFAKLAREVRQTETGTPVQSVPEPVYMAGELEIASATG